MQIKALAGTRLGRLTGSEFLRRFLKCLDARLGSPLLRLDL